MFATVLASSSKANCALIQTEETRLLIDLGLSAKRTAESLRAVGVQPGDINGILISHTHGDHVAGLGQWCKTVGTPVYVSREAAHEIKAQNLNHFDAPVAFMVGDILVEAFPVPHDAAGSVGFILTSKTGRLGFVTDCGSIPPLFEDALHRVDSLIIESNYDPDMLEACERPFELKQRIRSPIGHLSNGECAAVVNRLALNGLKYAVLAHLSTHANTPELARVGYVKCPIPITCAPPAGSLRIIC